MLICFSGLGQVSLDERRSKRGRGAEGEDHQAGGSHNAAAIGKRISEGQRQQGCSASTSAATTAAAAASSRISF